MDDLLPGDRVRYLEDGGIEEERIVYVAEVDMESGNGIAIVTSKGDRLTEYGGHNSFELVSRPRVPWLDDLQITGVISSKRAAARFDDEADLSTYVDHYARFRKGSHVNFWELIDGPIVLDEPLEIHISDIVHGNMSVLPSSFVWQLIGEAFKARDKPIPSNPNFSVYNESGRLRAHFGNLISWTERDADQP